MEKENHKNGGKQGTLKPVEVKMKISHWQDISLKNMARKKINFCYYSWKETKSICLGQWSYSWGSGGKAAKKPPKPRKQNDIPDSQHGSCTLYSVLSNAQARHAHLGDGAEQKPKCIVAQALGKINQNRVPGVDLVLSSLCTQNKDRPCVISLIVEITPDSTAGEIPTSQLNTLIS